MAKIVGKVGAVLTLIATLCGAYYATAKYHQNLGYTKAVTEISNESASKIAEATALAITNAEAEITAALLKQRRLFDAELVMAKEEQKVKVIIEDVYHEVEKIKYINNCGSLNSDSIRLLNKTINTVNNPPKN